MLVAGERMADQHRIGALGVERAVSLVGDLIGAEFDPGVELERLVDAKMSDQRVVRKIRLAWCIRRVKRATQIGLDHVALHAPGVARGPRN